MKRSLFAVATLVALLCSAPRAVITTLDYDDFEASLRSYWTAYAGAIARSNEIAGPDASTWVLKATATTPADIPVNYSAYVQLKPEQTSAGDRYFYERALDVGSWIGGRNRVLEFWAKPHTGYVGPSSTAGLSSGITLQMGTYTMGPTQKGSGNGYEARGFHGYHSLPFPGGIGWLKYKTMRPGKWRTTGNLPPSPRAVVSTTNGTPFNAQETVTCSPSGAAFTFGYEAEHAVVGQIAVFGLWHTYGVLPTTSDTCTGGSSGAVRTFSTVTNYNPSTYGENNTDPIGFWSGYWALWSNQGGMTQDWHDDYVATPKATVWDRNTRVYWGVTYVDSELFPTTDYFDLFTLNDDDRDDNATLANLGVGYDDANGKLWFAWERNVDVRNKTWEIRTSASDIHTLGFSNATAWQTQADCGCVYSIMSKYAAFIPPAQTFYVAVRPTDQSTFAQIAFTLPADPPGVGVAPGRTLRGRRR